MKKLASVSADIFHKHYADNAYVSAHGAKSLDQTHIVTYTHYKQLQGVGYFLNVNFLRKSNAPRVIVGIGGLGFDLDRAKFEDQLTKFIKYLPAHVELYVHAACHVKMLSYDSVTVLGSQNISSTSLPYLDAQASAISRHHEVQVEFQDADLTCARAIFNEILCDPSLHIKLSRKSIATDVVEHLLKGFSYEVHKRNMEFANALETFLGKDELMEKRLVFVPGAVENQCLVSLVQRIYAAKVVTEDHVDELFEVLYADVGDFPLGEEFTDDVFEISRTLESVNEASLPEKDQVLTVLRSIYSKEMPLAEGEAFSEFIDELKSVIEHHNVTDALAFANQHQERLVQKIIESPDYKQQAIMDATDNDGSMVEGRIREALLDGRIDFSGYEMELNLAQFISALHAVIESSYLAVVFNTFERMGEMHAKLLDIYQRELAIAVGS